MNVGKRACTETLDSKIGMKITSVEINDYYKNSREN